MLSFPSPRAFGLRKALTAIVAHDQNLVDKDISLDFLILNTLPDETVILGLDQFHSPELHQLAGDIRKSLSTLYAEVIEHNAIGDGEITFFYHIAGTTLYEINAGKLIRGRDHGKKCATNYNQVQNVLDKISTALEDEYISTERQEVLKNLQAEFLGHCRVLIIAMKTLPSETKLHISVHNKFNIDNIAIPVLDSEVAARIIALHPSVADGGTPKKVSAKAFSTQKAVNRTHPPSRLRAQPSPIQRPQEAENIVNTPWGNLPTSQFNEEELTWFKIGFIPPPRTQPSNSHPVAIADIVSTAWRNVPIVSTRWGDVSKDYFGTVLEKTYAEHGMIPNLSPNRFTPYFINFLREKVAPRIGELEAPIAVVSSDDKRLGK
ncbi:hypothetical protein [Candidatus Berkiella aquae]|uniref:Uncharacterized protein n=1 Tax=Candidatus Berkiella aquae TaxID=295108 RepID=A0A0Q9YS34_9GAMM|nr:hypothetical protein [Candidatus Berkiella aquae]MCS5712193.1 hypothetical protein [Candidatus Berkiella aquae]